MFPYFPNIPLVYNRRRVVLKPYKYMRPYTHIIPPDIPNTFIPNLYPKYRLPIGMRYRKLLTSYNPIINRYLGGIYYNYDKDAGLYDMKISESLNNKNFEESLDLLKKKICDIKKKNDLTIIKIKFKNDDKDIKNVYWTSEHTSPVYETNNSNIKKEISNFSNAIDVSATSGLLKDKDDKATNDLSSGNYNGVWKTAEKAEIVHGITSPPAPSYHKNNVYNIKLRDYKLKDYVKDVFKLDDSQIDTEGDIVIIKALASDFKNC